MLVYHPDSSIVQSLEERIQTVGTTIVRESQAWRKRQGVKRRWEEQFFEECMKDESLKNDLFQFILAYSHHPSSRYGLLNFSNDAITPIVSLWEKYMEKWDIGSLVPFAPAQFLIDNVIEGATSQSPYGRDILLAKGIRIGMSAMASNFIVASDIESATSNVSSATAKGVGYMYDILGEAALGPNNCDLYEEKVLRAMDHLERIYQGRQDKYGQPLASMAIKLSALTPHFDPLDSEGTKAELIPRLLTIFRRARDTNTALYIDSEHYDVRHLTYGIFKDVMERDEFKDYHHAGIVIQAYMKDSERIVHDMLGWGKKHHRRFTTRLVKGAYWDQEIADKQLRGLEPNVFMSKSETDMQFEKLTDLLLRHTDISRAAIASHNARSMVHAMELAKEYNVLSSDFEIQMLHGMGDEYVDSLLKRDVRVVKYGPVGTVTEGMKYFIRRLLENSSNQSFLRKLGIDADPREYLKKPASNGGKKPVMPALEFDNYPSPDWTLPDVRDKVWTALHAMKESCAHAPQEKLYINGQWREAHRTIPVRNPSTNELIGSAAYAEHDHIDEAVACAHKAQEGWSEIGVGKRVESLRRVSQIMQDRYYALLSRLVIEGGKTIREAAGEINEMIDFVNYYSDQALDFMQDRSLQSGLLGEENYTRQEPYGVVATIAPWNFPAAIFVGQIVAALATGNAVVAKPSEKTPLVAADIARIFEEAGLPEGVFNLVTTDGEERSYLVNHLGVAKIAFTGSYKTAKQIMQQIVSEDSPRSMNSVIAETGGINAVIVDACSDLELAAQGILRGAFGNAGQKCSATSRVIVHEAIYDEFMGMLVRGADALVVGDASNPRTDVSPIIDRLQYNSILASLAKAEKEGAVKLTSRPYKAQGPGNYLNPVVMEIKDWKKDVLGQTEVFGPVLGVIKYRSIEEAVKILNGTRFGLTGSIYSYDPVHVEHAVRRSQVGNMYVNKPTTGSIVGRQEFGGRKQSGTGPKAGGPDYLLAFTTPKTVSVSVADRGLPVKLDMET